MGKLKLLFLAVVVLGSFSSLNLSAQEQFNLENRGGHLYFTAAIRDTTAEFMVESGIPALLVGDGYYDTCFKASGLSFQPSQQKIRLLNHLYDIAYRTEGEIRIGTVIYDGPIFILEEYDGISIPIQYLKDPVSRQSVLAIDLKNKVLTVGKTEEKIDGTRFKLHFDKELGFPVVSAVVDIVTPEGRSKLKGDLIVDFGNPSLLFLLKQHKSLAKAIKRKTIVLQDAFDSQGQLVAQGLYANNISLFGQNYNDVSVGVTDRMQSIKQMGFLGIPFFETAIVFDFSNGVMIME